MCDGWCEQGGKQRFGDVSSLTLLLSYKDTNWKIYGDHHGSDSNSNLGITGYRRNGVDYNTLSQGGDVAWHAEGYIDLTTFQSLNS